MFRLSTKKDASQIFYLLNSPSNLEWTRQYVDSMIVTKLASEGGFVLSVVDGEIVEVAEHPGVDSVSRFASLIPVSEGTSHLGLLLSMLKGLIGKPALLAAYPLGQIAVDGSRGGESLYSQNLIERRWTFPSRTISSEVFFENEEELFQSSLRLASEKRSEVVQALLENYRLCSVMKKELIRHDH